LKVFENRVMWRIFGSERDEVRRELRRLHGKELYALYSARNVIRVIKSRRLRWAGHIARMRHSRGAYRLLVETSEVRNHFGSPRSGIGDIDWINVAQDRDRML
jgi:hypothetical protein